MASRRRVKPRYPFVFVGEGFVTSYKCLEGYLWFEKPPRPAARKRIVALVPRPLLLGARFEGCIMHFGSDDRLESFVKATYNPKYARMDFEKAVEMLEAFWRAGSDAYIPTRREWAAFNDHFDRATTKIHRISKLRLALKPGNGEYGTRLGPWHRWSVKNATPLAALAANERRKTTRDLSFLAANFIQDVLRDRTRMHVEERKAWLAWLDKLAVEGDWYSKDAFVGMAKDLVQSAPEERQAELLFSLRAPLRRKLRDASA
jgi:hypothetical protein